MPLLRKLVNGQQSSTIPQDMQRILYRQPVRGVPISESYQQRQETDVLLGYIVEGPLPPSLTGKKQKRRGPIHRLVDMATEPESYTVQRPLWGPPAAMQSGPTGAVYVQGTPYYQEG